jgi:hypothetical protein
MIAYRQANALTGDSQRQHWAKFSHRTPKFEWLPLRLTWSPSVIRALGAFRDRRKKKDIPVPNFILSGAPTDSLLSSR